MDKQLARRLAAEFIGTFALIFMGAGAIIVGSGLVGVAFAHGLAIAACVTALGHISGGVFNPALTVGLMGDEAHDVARRCHVHPGAARGATAGAAVLLTFPQALRDVATGVPDLAGVDFVQGTVIEAVLTFFLMLVVFDGYRPPRAARRRLRDRLRDRDGHLRGRAHHRCGHEPGACLRTGVDLQPVEPCVGVLIGLIIGAVLAALVYHYVFLDDEQRVEAAA